jgi:hypothetical protein
MESPTKITRFSAKYAEKIIENKIKPNKVTIEVTKKRLRSSTPFKQKIARKNGTKVSNK